MTDDDLKVIHTLTNMVLSADWLGADAAVPLGILAAKLPLLERIGLVQHLLDDEIRADRLEAILDSAFGTSYGVALDGAIATECNVNLRCETTGNLVDVCWTAGSRDVRVTFWKEQT